MTTITVPITLPEDLAKRAEDAGLLSSVAIEAYVLETLAKTPAKIESAEIEYPSDFDPRLKGAVNPAAFRRGKIIGDIIEPIDVEWEAAR